MKFQSAFQKLIRKWVSKSKLTPNDSMSSMMDDQVSEFCNWLFGLKFLRILFYVSIVWLCCSIFLDVQIIICNTSMFQRSGALLVAAAALLEFGSGKHLAGYTISYSGKDENWHLRLITYQRSGQILGILGIIVGTLVWAYGDFLFFANCN